MAENDSRDDVRTLYREAARTKTDDERVIVEKIDRLTQSIGRADEEIARIRGQIREVAARRIEIDPPSKCLRWSSRNRPDSRGGVTALSQQVTSEVILMQTLDVTI